jgi:cytochrome P450
MSERLPRPPAIAQLGYMRRLLRDPIPVLDELSGRYGPVFELGAGPMRMAVVGDPNALRDVFMAPTDAYRWGHKFNVLGFVVGAGSMIVSDGADHKRRRGSVQRAFSRRRLNGWIPMMLERSDRAFDDLAARAGTAPIDVYPFGRRLVLDIVVHALFGARLSDRVDEIGMLFERPQAYLESPAIQQFPHPLPHTKRARVRDDRRALDAIIDGAIADIRRAPSAEPEDVLEALVQDATLTDAEIRDQVVTLIGAGFDSTSSSFAWMLWCAGLHPEVWEAVRAEADRVLTGTPDNTMLTSLEYTNRVMRETLRLHPAGVISPRETTRDIEVGGHTIRKGTLILWSPYLTGRDPDAWTDPLRFDPDRWLTETDEQKQLADHAWAPFGGGARNCIGFALAQMELTIMLARCAQRFEITPAGTVEPKPVGMVVNRPMGGAPMKVLVRSAS